MWIENNWNTLFDKNNKLKLTVIYSAWVHEEVCRSCERSGELSIPSLLWPGTPDLVSKIMIQILHDVSEKKSVYDG